MSEITLNGIFGHARKPSEDRDSDVERRIRLIAHRNPGYSVAIVRQAAVDEIDAVRALAAVEARDREAATIHLRAMQVRSANLDISVVRARELARIQVAADLQRPTNDS